MKSPFFWQNSVLVLLLIANFAFSVWLLIRNSDEPRLSKEESAPTVENSVRQETPLALRLAVRTFCVFYATSSCLIVFVLGLHFKDNEFSPQNQECWRQRSEFPRIALGMTQKHVLEFMEKPEDVWRKDDNDQYRYRLSPSGMPDMGIVFFNADPKNLGGDVIVVDKWPDDKRLMAFNHSWRSHLKFEYSGRSDALCDKTMGLSCVAIMLLAFISLLPIWPCASWRAIALYFPVIALTLAGAHEATRRGDLRLMVFLVAPGSVVVMATWLFRLIRFAIK